MVVTSDSPVPILPHSTASKLLGQSCPLHVILSCFHVNDITRYTSPIVNVRLGMKL